MKKDYWYNRQLRMLQTVLREPDIVDYDAEAVVKYLKDTHSNSIIVNAGGIIDFFENDAKLSRRNAFMTKENMMGDLVSKCHENDIRVMVRIDFRGVEKERFETSPDWFAQDSEGNAKIGWGKIYKPCYNGIYANDYAVKFVENMMKKYDIDGVWENCVGFGDGPCYCPRCRDLFRKATGKEIPVNADYAGKEFEEYRNWKAECADRHIRRMRDTVKSFGEEKAYCAEIFGMFHASNALNTGIDLYNAKDYFDFLVSPAFQDGSANPSRKWDDLSYAGSSMKFLKAIDDEKQTVLLYGNNGTKWRYVKAPAIDTKIWMWEAAAVGAGFWNCYFNGQCPARTVDNRNQGLETEVYQYLEENQELLRGQSPKAEVGIFYSKPTRDALGRDDEAADQYGVFIKGVESALIDHHIQYNFIPDLYITEELLKDLKVLILPNTARISDEHLEMIRKYVAEGGGLIASYETSLYDENGIRRADFGLKDVFGCSFTGIRKNTSVDCYQMVRKHHPILDHMDIENTRMIMNEGSTLLCRLAEETDSEMVCSYIPMIENQPPEFAWIPKEETDYATIVANSYGKGKAVYFANQTDKLVYTNGHEDFRNTFMNAVNWVKKEPFMLKVDAPSSVHVVLMEDKSDPNRKIISLVNTTSSGKRPLRELCPVYDIDIKLILEGGELGESCQMKGNAEITWRKEEDGLAISIHVKELKEFAAVYLNIK